MTYSKTTIASASTKFGIAAATAALGLAALVGVPALATPGSGFVPSPFPIGALDESMAMADKTGKWDMMIKTKGTTTVGVDQLTAQPGGYSGWHTHTGLTLVTVTSGTINWVDGETCAVKTYHAGDSFIEPANRAHNVKNPYGNTATFVAVQMRPEGTGPRIDVAVAPPNCNQ